ncbi:MAG: hypothetical protein HFJ42_09980 [Clostridia bacterium]|nr:hypothetical protein [Clostridia bacterium]
MEDNIVMEEIEFSEELYKKNITENTFVEEYEGGEINADNECCNATEQI